MTQKMVCPPSPLGYTKYERRYYAGDWWYRVSPSSPWQLCVGGGDDHTGAAEMTPKITFKHVEGDGSCGVSNIVFFAGEVVRVVGADLETECSHCGRPLKVGVRLEGFVGAFGADCLAKSFVSYTYNSRRYKYGSDEIKQRAIVARKGEDCAKRHGLGPHHFRFVLKTPLRSI